MNIHMFGKSKRYTKEKRIKCQLLDLRKHGMSLGEYKKINKVFTPIVRNTRQAYVDFVPDMWKEWV
ncbi:MAG: hypothetical protein ACK5JH_01440 [Anaerocolumna sp.]